MKTTRLLAHFYKYNLFEVLFLGNIVFILARKPITIGIINTNIWKRVNLNHFYLFIRDSRAIEGFVRINVGREACSKSNAVDGSISLRAKLHVVQASLLMHFVTVS